MSVYLNGTSVLLDGSGNVAIDTACCCDTGACCHGGICTQETEAGCADLSGNFFGLGSSCSGRNCGVGACCYPPCTCTDGLTLEECLGVFQGYGTTCADFPCPTDIPKTVDVTMHFTGTQISPDCSYDITITGSHTLDCCGSLAFVVSGSGSSGGCSYGLSWQIILNYDAISIINTGTGHNFIGTWTEENWPVGNMIYCFGEGAWNAPVGFHTCDPAHYTCDDINGTYTDSITVVWDNMMGTTGTINCDISVSVS